MQDALLVNKIAAAILTAALIAMTAGFIASFLYSPTELAQDAFVIEVEEGAAQRSKAAQEAKGVDIDIDDKETPICEAVDQLQNLVDIIDCEPFDADASPADRRYHLRVEFTHMREADRDVLIRHILRRQGDELRARRQREDQ